MPKTVPDPTDAAPTASGRAPVEPARRALGHLHGLDGLRAIAVLAVVAYHAGMGWLGGGFLGVEVFFVISGYLITALLLAEHRATGRIDVVRFWLRRARRLLPALFLLLLATLGLAVLVIPDELARLRGDAVAAFAYVTNWHLIAGDRSYFESIGRPSLFLHLWSLAIEEQFYLVWPIVLAAALAIGRRAGFTLAVAGALASAGWLAVLFDPTSDPSRVYYGTDTRLTGLLLGSALAFAWVPPVADVVLPGPDMSRRRRRKLQRAVDRVGRWASAPLALALDVVGLAALAGLGTFFTLADAYEPMLYQGGLALLAATTAVLIAAVVHPRSRLGRVLELAPLRWLGTRSYAVYLWHWPIFALTRPGLDVPLDPIPALVVRLGLTAALAELSYRFVEMPIRRGGLTAVVAWLRTPRPLAGHQPRRWPAPAAAGGLAALLTILLVSVAIATPPALPEGLVTTSIDQLVVDPADQAAVPEPSLPAPQASARPAATATAATTATPGASTAVVATPSAVPATTPKPARPARPRRDVLAFGESVMIQGAQALARDLGPVRVDAAVGRHVNEGVEILRERAAAGDLADTVIVQLGNNGPFRAGQFDAAMQALHDVPLVVWVNVRVPRDWEAHNNRIIESGVARYPNARLVDWYDATADRPDLFWKDGYHPKPEGAKLYADLIAQQVEAAEQQQADATPPQEPSPKAVSPAPASGAGAGPSGIPAATFGAGAGPSGIPAATPLP